MSDGQTFYPQNRLHHYIEAERLLDEGVKIVNKISEIADRRATDDVIYRPELTRRMDELGKKAMGIWAQAQVHATLANAAPTLDLGKPMTISKG